MAKKDNSARIAELNTLISDEKAQIAAVNSYIADLRAYDTTTSYVLQNHSNIKSTYQLAGSPYATMADTEEATAKAAGTGFSGIRDEMIQDLVEATRGMSMNIATWKQQIANLSD